MTNLQKNTVKTHTVCFDGFIETHLNRTLMLQFSFILHLLYIIKILYGNWTFFSMQVREFRCLDAR